MRLKSNGYVLGGVILMLAIFFSAVAPAAETTADDGKLRIIVFGAHPDDCELRAAGCAIMWAKQGHHVKFVSTTNGDIGHAVMAGGELAKRRTAEVQKVAKLLGIETEVLDIHDGELMPTLENRRTILRLIREWKADLVLTHRTNDYHPDHRYTGILVQDAAFMVTVPSFCPGTPHLSKNPVFMYSSDRFKKPAPFEADIAVAIDDVFDQKVEALWQLESQIESLWALRSFEGVVPVPKAGPDREARRQEVAAALSSRFEGVANNAREKLIELYGKREGGKVRYAESFGLSEYGYQPSPEELKKLFPFFGQ